MDRNKSGTSSRGQKKGPSHLGGELFALGTKGTRDETKSKIVPIKGISSSDRKREACTSFGSSNKRLRLNVKDSSDSAATSTTGQYEPWEQLAKDFEPSNFMETAYDAINQKDKESVIRLICSTLKHITTINVRNKIDHVALTTLTYFCKLHPKYFCNDVITGALVSILRRDSNVKSRYGANIHILAVNLLTRSYIDRAQWPEVFLRLYIEDSINERFWADNELCAPFINNICAAFQTRVPPTNLLRWDTNTASSIASNQAHRDINISIDDDSGDNSAHGIESNIPIGIETEQNSDKLCTVQKRFSDSVVEKFVIDAIKDQLNKRQQQDNYTRNFLKFLCTTSGIAEVRYICISRLELWMHNGKLVKFAQQLLSYICCNIKSKDHEVLAVLVKMRLKTKPLINHYMACLKEVVNLQRDILNITLKLVVQNELSNTRNPNNMGMLATMFQVSPEQSASILAEIYQESLLQKDDCLRTLRVFLRELVRILRFDVNIIQFCKVFLSERLDLAPQIEQSEFRERIFHSTVDIVCLCMLLSVTPQAREACLVLRLSREPKDNQVLMKFYNQMSQIQLDAVSWMFESVPHLYKIQSTDYSQALHKLLLLDNAEQYSRADQWPSEPERSTLLRMISETPVHEETLLRIIVIGITKEIPFSIPDTFDIILLVIKRVSTMKITNISAVQANKFEIIDFLFSMSEYHPPENIKLPDDYEPPKLAIIVLYWKAWLILLMISAHNPSNFGAFCWDHYPTMKMLMEMCITNQFNNNNLLLTDELQILPMEKDHILQFETYLAAHTTPQTVITEENAILISQLMLMDPMGPARKIPTVILDQLRFLNQTYKLGHLLCRSRKPDLLLDIIQRQGTTQSMPWLSDLVQNSEGDLNHLPVQCLCEFLLFNAHNINEENSRDAELVNFLRNLIMDPNFNKQAVCEVLDYIFRRLSSTVKQSRLAAITGIKIIFKSNGEFENEWLLKSMQMIPHFDEVKAFVIPQLRSACQVENCPDLVMAYIQFIAAHTLNDPVIDMVDHVIDMAQLIVERNTMFQHIVIPIEENCALSSTDENRIQTLKCLFVMFNNYIIKLREYNESYEWNDYPDLLMVQFDDGVQLPLHVNIIHAFIILLTYSNSNMAESIPILDYWFPPGRPSPVAFLPNMPQEPVQLLPDWLKLKMIRSPVDRLIEAALQELTPDQIVLFVQNFGTPVNSMSKLLALLDTAVLEQFDAVKNAILNKAYLAQLIEIQQARGAKNGHYTVQALELHSHAQTVPDLPYLEVNILENVQIDDCNAIEITTNSSSKLKNVDDIVQTIIKNPETKDNRYRRLIHHILKRHETSTGQMVHSETAASSKTLQSILRTFEKLNISSLNQHNIMSNRPLCTLIRIILSEKLPAESYDLFEKILSNEVCQQNPNQSQILLTIIRNGREKLKGNNLKLKNEKRKIIYEILESFKRNSVKNVCNDGDNELKIESKSELRNELSVLCHNGLFIDWLAEVDPETISRQLFNVRFLFSKKCSEFRIYLLSLINHQTNWDTVMFISDCLLSKNNKDTDATTVLNYYEALNNNPKLWRGFDRTGSKNKDFNNVFLLQDNELKTFTEYILQEGIFEISNPSNASKYDYILSSRIELLFKLTDKQATTMMKFVQYVMNDSCPEQLKSDVMEQLYLMHPSIKFLKLKAGGDMQKLQQQQQQKQQQVNKLQILKGCPADKVLTFLITCLGSLTSKKDFDMLASDTELLLRKLAASHPALFLRQLNVLSSFIQGQAQNSIHTLREGHHFHRFLQILRTLELLQPMIFENAYRNDLESTLSCYFKFFKHHSSVREAYQILIRFVQLLQSYINVNPTHALHFIEQYVGILMELAAKYSGMVTLQQLVQGVVLLQHRTSISNELDDEEVRQEFELEEMIESKAPNKSPANNDFDAFELGTTATQFDASNKGTASFVIAGTYSKSNTPFLSPHFYNLVKVLREAKLDDEILVPLQEIECLTSRRFSFVNELFDILLDLIFSKNSQIRSIAFIILIRHLKQNPGDFDINKCTLNAYIQCLQNENSSIAMTALEYMCEVTVLLQEYANEILGTAFSLGMKSKLNTCTQIKKVLQTLMIQHGY